MTRARGWARGTALGAAALSLLLGLGTVAPQRQALVDFYERYYRAERMQLVVQGPQALDELQARSHAAQRSSLRSDMQHGGLWMEKKYGFRSFHKSAPQA